MYCKSRANAGLLSFGKKYRILCYVVIVSILILNFLSIAFHLTRGYSVKEDNISPQSSDPNLLTNNKHTILVKEDNVSSPSAEPILLTNNNHTVSIKEDNSLSKFNTPLSSLSNPDLFFPKITELYKKYGHEIAAFRPEMRKWCKKVNSCKFCDYEAEMLYMLLRESKPQRVFEMAPNLGYSSHWILHALRKNDNTSQLHSYDIHGNSKKRMKKQNLSRWKFTLGDYAELFDTGKLVMDEYDFIFIDALHEPTFARGYCERLLARHKRKAIVAIHDIVAANGDGRESSEVYKHIAMNNHIHNVFTMADKFIPNFVHPIVGIVAKINEIRVEVGIIKPCKPQCNESAHDTLYITVNNSPTIFFELNHI